MPKRVYIALAVLLVMLAGVSAWLGLHAQNREPVYRGKPLRYWLRGYRAGNLSWNQSTAETANEAVKHMGTNAIPTLLEMFSASDSALDIKLLKWSYTWRRWAGKQHFFKISPSPHLRSYEALEALIAFRALGPEASGAVPGLIHLLNQNPPAWNQVWIEGLLGEFGPAAKQAVPALLRKSQDSSPYARRGALDALGKIGTEPDRVVPVLINALHDPDSYVRGSALGALGKYGPNAKLAVPALVAFLNASNDSANTMLAADALKAIDPAAAAQAGVK
ncbi:MAG: HEAT repeat domain-containing protein [Limisphaerales bacterium]